MSNSPEWSMPNVMISSDCFDSAIGEQWLLDGVESWRPCHYLAIEALSDTGQPMVDVSAEFRVEVRTLHAGGWEPTHDSPVTNRTDWLANTSAVRVTMLRAFETAKKWRVHLMQCAEPIV